MIQAIEIQQVPTCAVMNSICSSIEQKKCCYQLLFYSDIHAHRLSLYLITESDNPFSLQNCVAQTTNHLSMLGYKVRKPSNEFIRLMTSLCMQGRAYGLRKGELAVTSPYSYCGFYYFADRLSENANNSSLAPLFDVLLQHPGTQLIVQLVPTQLYEEEQAALSELSGSLELLCTHGVPGFGGQLIREPYAREAYECYDYYNKLAGQPLYLLTIVIGAQTQAIAERMTAVLRSYLSSEDGRQPRLECIPLPQNLLNPEDIGNFPIQVQHYLHTCCRNPAIWQSCDNPPWALARLPFLVSAEEADRIFKLPTDDGRTPGIVSNAVPMDYSTIPSKNQDMENILFGRRMGYDQVLGCPPNHFAQHMLIVGKPGTGKTTFALNLLLQFHRKGIPFLAIEPTKAEYRALIDVIDDLQVFTPGNSEVSLFAFNPFIPPDGLTVEQYRPSLFSAFRVAFDMPSPLDTFFESTIGQAYAAYGWRSHSRATDPDVRPFGLYEFVLEFKKKLAKQNYSKEVMGNLQSGGTMRLMNLIEQNPILYDTQSTIPLADLLSKPTIIELNAIDSAEQKELLMALLLIQICVHTKHRKNSNGQLKNVLLIDEAHVLLDAKTSTDSNGNRKENMAAITLQNMAAEIRSFGTSIIVADQSAIKVGSGMRANTDIKVAFQLTERAEIEAIANCTNMTAQQTEAMVTLEKGQAYTFFSGLKNPQLIITPDIRKDEKIRLAVTDEEIAEKSTYVKTHARELRPYSLCKLCPECIHGCNLHEREEAAFLARRLLNSVDAKLTTKEKLFGLLEHYEEMHRNSSNRKRHRCVQIQLARSAVLEKNFVVPEGTLELLFSQLWKEEHS